MELNTGSAFSHLFVLCLQFGMELVKEIMGDENAAAISAMGFSVRKNLYRAGIFKCSGYVDVETSPAEVMRSGTCGCLDLDLEKVSTPRDGRSQMGSPLVSS